MRCKIEGCNHTTHSSLSLKHHGISWKKYGICACCVIELMGLGVLNEFFRISWGCKRKIQSELELRKTRDSDQADKLRKKNFAKREQFLQKVGIH